MESNVAKYACNCACMHTQLHVSNAAISVFSKIKYQAKHK